MPKYSKSLWIALSALACALSGCTAAEGDFPTLSKRAYETDDPLAIPASATAPLTTALPADLTTLTNAMVARSAAAQTAFESALPAARNAAASASGAAPGGESWVNAHMLVSRADGQRADGVAALGEIDQLIAREREKGADAGLLALLAIPQRVIADRVTAQNAEIDRLARQIGL